MTASKNAHQVPYRQLDPAIVPLVRVLNRFPAVHTIGSCGGHDEPDAIQADAGAWWVTFAVDHTQAGWVSLEFLAWAINRALASPVVLTPNSYPPFLNWPGRELLFVLELPIPCEVPHTSPAGLADWLTDLRRQFYVTARRAEHWADDESGYSPKPITD
jgi:hypothetical protein